MPSPTLGRLVTMSERSDQIRAELDRLTAELVEEEAREAAEVVEEAADVVEEVTEAVEEEAGPDAEPEHERDVVAEVIAQLEEKYDLVPRAAAVVDESPDVVVVDEPAPVSEHWSRRKIF